MPFLILGILMVSGRAALAAQSPMVFTHLSTAQGLSQATVNDILQDSQGFLWLATENGLNRYDGIRVQRYYRERNNPQGLAADFIRAMDEDANGDLWLATEGSGLVRWSRRSDTFVSYRHREDDRTSLASDVVRGVLVARNGMVWAATRDAGLDRLNPDTGVVTHFVHHESDAASLSSNQDLYTVLEDSSGHIWVGTRAGLDRYDPDTNSFEHFTPPETSSGAHIILSLLQDHLGQIWVGTFDSGLLQLDPQTGQFTVYRHSPEDAQSLGNDQIGAIFEDDEKRLWVGNSSGLDLLNRETGAFQHFAHDRANPNSLAENSIRSIAQDRSGLLWVGTGSSGVSRWNPRSWSLGHREPMWLPELSMINAFADAPDGAMWFGTSAGLVSLDANGKVVEILDRQMLGDDTVMTVLADREGQLWIGTVSGGLTLRSADGSLQRFVPESHDWLGASGIMSMYEDRQGRVWIGTFEGGLSVYDPATRTFHRYKDENGSFPAIKRMRCSAITQDAQGRIWVATSGDGLLLVDPQQRRVIHRFVHDPNRSGSIAANSIYSLHADEAGGLWVGTGGGGLDYAPNVAIDALQIRFENISQPDGLSNDVIYGIQPDGNGHLWLPSNNGLMRLNAATREVRTYYPSHGAQSEEFSFGAHYRSVSGKLYFAGNGGYNVFDPLKLQETMVEPPVLITHISVQNQPVQSAVAVPLLNTLTLQHNDNSLLLEFAALDFTDPKRNQFAYKLEGFDNDWVALRNEHRVSYTNLAQGRYVFRVKAASADSVWNNEGAQLAVTVLPAPWQTWWAYVLYVAFAALLAAAIYRRQTRRLRQQQKYARLLAAEVQSRTAELNERNKQLADASAAKSNFLARMSHEIRTPMNGVMGMAELLSNTALNPQQHQYTQTITRSTQALLQIINDILDLSKIEAGRVELEERPFDFEYVINDCIALLAPTARDKHLAFFADVDPQTPRILIGDELRIRQVLINLLGNALKFTAEGEVWVKTTVAAQSDNRTSLRVEIVDTGVGIPQDGLVGVFDAFSQVDESTTRRFGGTGLGLSICKQLVELMGGDIGVASREGEGSTFWFELTLQAQSLSHTVSSSENFTLLAILLELPEGPLRDAVARRLRAEGATVSLASRSADADQQASEGYDVCIKHADGRDSREPASHTEAGTGSFIANDPFLEVILGESSVAPSLAAETESAVSNGRLLDARVQTVHLTQPVAMSEVTEAIFSWLGGAGLPEGEEAPGDESVEAGDTAGQRILIVEDNAVNQLVAVGLLEQLGYQTATAENGREALEILTSDVFDLVLMDCQMPVMDGFEATRDFRAAEKAGCRMPIVGLTAHASEESRLQCLAAGMDDFVSKPYTAEELSGSLERWLKNRVSE